MSFDNNSFYDDNSTKNWQPQPTPMEDRRRRHTGKWITAILILGLLALAVTGTVHLVRDVGVTINRSDTGFLLTVGTQPIVQMIHLFAVRQAKAFFGIKVFRFHLQHFDHLNRALQVFVLRNCLVRKLPSGEKSLHHQVAHRDARQGRVHNHRYFLLPLVCPC